MSINNDILYKIDSEIGKDKKVVELKKEIERLKEENKKYSKWIESLNKDNHRLNSVIEKLEQENTVLKTLVVNKDKYSYGIR